MVDVPQPRMGAVPTTDPSADPVAGPTAAVYVTRDADESNVTRAHDATSRPDRPAGRGPVPSPGTYHTGRFTKVPRLAKHLRVPTPADRSPGQPWRPGTPPPAPVDPNRPTADIRIGHARCSSLAQELQSQLDALATHGIDRDKIFSEKISSRVKVRPEFEKALATARQIKAHAPHCRVILTVYEMKGTVNCSSVKRWRDCRW
jgi:hypothetical protein